MLSICHISPNVVPGYWTIFSWDGEFKLSHWPWVGGNEGCYQILIIHFAELSSFVITLFCIEMREDRPHNTQPGHTQQIWVTNIYENISYFWSEILHWSEWPHHATYWSQWWRPPSVWPAIKLLFYVEPVTKTDHKNYGGCEEQF